MGQPYIGEIRLVSFNFPPKGWAFCNGQTMAIAQNQALFSLLGTTFGGNGTTTFLLPNLQGRMAVHQGNGIVMGETAGEAAHTLLINEMPQHSHQVNASGAADNGSPAGHLPAVVTQNYYATGTANASMNPAAVGNQGGSQSHNNMSPYLVVNFIIALNGIFPSRN